MTTTERMNAIKREMDTDPIQFEPTETQLWLYEKIIAGIYIEYRQMGTDTAESIIIFTDIDGKIKECRLSEIINSIDFKMMHNAVCQLNYQIYNKITEYKAWKDRNKKDIAEYNRLKKKLGL